MTISWHCLECNEKGDAGVDLFMLMRDPKYKGLHLFDLLGSFVKRTIHKSCKDAIIGVKINENG